ncbi:MAG: helix-turn-helix domain-containing protein [Candidatus Daviesbacteria bacterium]|nr:helix-turn-helix domain-containing protein [Candidatus Daviesbacteria bacterium]
MRTVGQILKEEREKKFYTLEEIEKITKIRIELLKALENDDYIKLPPPTFVQGFIKNYGKFLKLDTSKLLAIYRREYSIHKNPPRILDSFISPIDKKRLRITPAKLLGTIVVVLIFSFFAYLWFEYRFLAGTPFLEISQPNDQETYKNEVIIVSGRTDPEAKVSINDQEIQVDISGRFSQEIRLKESINSISITARSKEGKETEVERNVFYKPE